MVTNGNLWIDKNEEENLWCSVFLFGVRFFFSFFLCQFFCESIFFLSKPKKKRQKILCWKLRLINDEMRIEKTTKSKNACNIIFVVVVSGRLRKVWADRGEANIFLQKENILRSSFFSLAYHFAWHSTYLNSKCQCYKSTQMSNGNGNTWKRHHCNGERMKKNENKNKKNRSSSCQFDRFILRNVLAVLLLSINIWPKIFWHMIDIQTFSICTFCLDVRP